MADDAKRQLDESPMEAEASEGSVLDQLLSKVDGQTSAPEGEMDLDKALESSGGRLSFAINHLIQAIAETETRIEKIDKVLIDSVISGIDQKLTSQLNEIMHHENFQKLESSWRGLQFAVDRTDFRQNIKVEMLNCTKEKLLEDFDDAPETVQSGLYKQLYTHEYDTPGADPFSFIVANYEFDRSAEDITLLQNVAKVAAATHCPFISAVNPHFFGMDSLDPLTNHPDIHSIFETHEYIKWKAFRESEDSRYVGLTLNKFLLRLPYGQDGQSVKGFNYEEDVVQDANRYLWGNPAFAFMANVNRSFANHGWAVNIRGPQGGGMVEDLPVHIFTSPEGGQYRIPTEIIVPETKEFELAENGFIPLSVYKNKDYAVFFGAQSTQKPQKYDTASATANAKLSANLPYLFLVSRLSHYLKVMQREVIGSQKEKEDLQEDLNRWIRGLVTEDVSPTAEQKAKFPLREASVEVTESPDSPGFYHVSMKVRPHFQVEGVNVDLSLVSRLPNNK